MSKIFTFLLVLTLVLACKDAPVLSEEGQEQGWTLDTESLPKKNMVNAKAASLLGNWKEFTVFETSFDRLYTCQYAEDLILVTEDLIEKQKELEASQYPSKFDIPQVKGRQKVLKTYILKVKGDLEYRVNPDVSIKEMVNAYNALRNQFNVVVNNTLPQDLILNEKN